MELQSFRNPPPKDPVNRTIFTDTVGYDGDLTIDMMVRMVSNVTVIVHLH